MILRQSSTAYPLVSRSMVMVLGLPTLHREGQETLAWDFNSSSFPRAKIALGDAGLYAEMKD